MSITAVIPVWNGRESLGRLLDSLEAQTVPVAELLVVDNGSSDGAPELAARRGARVIPMGRNAGFAAAVNRGIQSAQSHWIAVLNSDVELARTTWRNWWIPAAGSPPARSSPHKIRRASTAPSIWFPAAARPGGRQRTPGSAGIFTRATYLDGPLDGGAVPRHPVRTRGPAR